VVSDFFLRAPSLPENKIRAEAELEVENLCHRAEQRPTKSRAEALRADIAGMVVFYASKGWQVSPALAKALQSTCLYPNRQPRDGVPEAIDAAKNALSESWGGQNISDYQAKNAAETQIGREHSRSTYRRHLPEIKAEVLAQRSAEISERIEAQHTSPENSHRA
jgi:hypothetical protein